MKVKFKQCYRIKKIYLNVINYFLVAHMNLGFKYLIYTNDVKKLTCLPVYIFGQLKCVSKEEYFER